ANNPVTGSATGLGPVQANAGTVLGGTGRIAPAAGNSIVLSGATLNPGLPGIGNNAGTLILETSGSGQLQMTGSSKMLLDLVLGAGMGSNIQDATAADLLVIRGILDLQEGSVLQVGNPNALTAWAANDQWKLFDWSGLTAPVTGAFGSYDLPALPEGLVWNTDELFTTGILSISLVPEPGRLGLLGLALAGLAGRRRRP
ncbi:MAG TPA: PEP-CTERM sorting domain-containing protein, partial [Prosthecobacter sp.]